MKLLCRCWCSSPTAICSSMYSGEEHLKRHKQTRSFFGIFDVEKLVMLTININDSYLEKSIAEKARLIGKSTQEIVVDLLMKALPETDEMLSYPKLNPEECGYVMNFKINESISSGEIETVLFSHVDNTVNFSENLQKSAWRKQ